MRSDARALLSQRLLGDLDDDLLSFLEQVADRRRGALLSRFAARCLHRALLRHALLGARIRVRRAAAAFGQWGTALASAFSSVASAAPHAARNAVLQVARTLFAQGRGQAGRNAG